MSGIASISYDSPLVPEGGLFTIKNASKMLSEFGRNGDTYVVHAKEGETVIPMEVLDNNPRLKKMLFQQMRELDLDPARYIVGITNRRSVFTTNYADVFSYWFRLFSRRFGLRTKTKRCF
jgi:hypothetical protein